MTHSTKRDSRDDEVCELRKLHRGVSILLRYPDVFNGGRPNVLQESIVVEGPSPSALGADVTDDLVEAGWAWRPDLEKWVFKTY